MTNRATFTLDKEAYAFLTTVGGKNRSAFINRLLRAEKQRQMAKKILQANLEEANDAYHKEITDWDIALDDGLLGK